MKRFEVSSALKSSNAVKIKGFAVIEIFQYLFMLVFAHRSIYMDMKRDMAINQTDNIFDEERTDKNPQSFLQSATTSKPDYVTAQYGVKSPVGDILPHL